MRQALIDAITPTHIQEIALAILIKARSGDLPAARFLFSYVLGKPPQQPVDPDQMDQQEWKYFQDTADMFRELPGVVATAEPGLFLDVVRATRPEVSKSTGKIIADTLVNGEAPPTPTEEYYGCAPRKRPSANGENGPSTDANGVKSPRTARSRGKAPPGKGVKATKEKKQHFPTVTKRWKRRTGHHGPGRGLGRPQGRGCTVTKRRLTAITFARVDPRWVARPSLRRGVPPNRTSRPMQTGFSRVRMTKASPERQRPELDATTPPVADAPGSPGPMQTGLIEPAADANGV